MHQLREVPFFDVHPVQCDTGKLYSKVNLGQCTVLDGLPITAAYLTGVCGCNALWVGNERGQLLRLQLATSPPVEKRGAHHDVNAGASLPQHAGLYETTTPNVESQQPLSRLTVTNVTEFDIFSSCLTQLLISDWSKTRKTPFLAGVAEKTSKPSILNAAEPPSGIKSLCTASKSPCQSDREVLIAIGRQAEHDWKCKVFLIDRQGAFLKKGSEASTKKAPSFRATSSVPNEDKNPSRRSMPETEVVEPIKEIVLADFQGLANGNRQEVVVSAADLNPRGTKLAVGFSNGCVVLYRGDFALPESSIRGRRVRFGAGQNFNESSLVVDNDAFSTPSRKSKQSNQKIPPADERQRISHDPVTNLVFGYINSHQTDVLFITTINSVSCVTVPDDAKAETVILFNESTGGCLPRCAALLRSTTDGIYDRLCVMRDACLFVYTAEQGNLSALPYYPSGACKGFKTYSVVLSQFDNIALEENKAPENADFPHVPSPPDALVSSALQLSQPKSMLSVIVNTPTFRFVVFTARMDQLIDVLPWNDNGFLVVAGFSSLRLLHVVERSSTDRIDALVQKRLFDWAVEIAKIEGAPEDVIEGIHVLHGHWLFDKKYYTEAAHVYSRTYRTLEPSHVISRFLEEQQLDSLSLYLQGLYHSGLATKTHLALLFKCFCIRRDEQGFSAFLDATQRCTGESFDWSAAIEECRISGDTRLAKKIALKAELKASLLSILTQDESSFDEALNVLNGLPAPETCSLLLQTCIGHPLLRARPKETSTLIQNLIDKEHLDVFLFLSLFLNVKFNLTSSSNNHVCGPPKKYALVSRRANARLEIDSELEIHFLAMVLKGLNRAVQDVDTAPPVGGSALSVALEILLRHWFQKSTALDCLLVDDKISLDDLIESLLVHHFKSNESLLSAFCLTRLYGYSKGLLLVCERIAALCGTLGHSEQHPLWTYGALHSPLLTDGCDSERLVHYCARYGEKDPGFWYLTFPFFSSAPHCHAVKQLLRCLRQQSAQDNQFEPLCPLTVIRLLLPRPRSTQRALPEVAETGPVEDQYKKQGQRQVFIGDVKDFLIETIVKAKHRFEQLKQRADSDLFELQQRRIQLRRVREDLHCFYAGGQSCSHCTALLSVPLVRFLCGHVYHRLCLESFENSETCPKCAPDHRLKQHLFAENSLLLIKTAQEDSSYRDVLHTGPTPIMSYVAALVGHGLLQALRGTPLRHDHGKQKLLKVDDCNKKSGKPYRDV